MKLTIKTNFSFSKVNRRINAMMNSSVREMRQGGAEDFKANIDSGISPPLKEKTTMQVRKIRGISGDKPLYATGALYDSIKEVKDGVQMMEYGLFHDKGFKPRKIPVVRKNYYMMMKNLNTRVPERNFITIKTETFVRAVNSFWKEFTTALRK